MITQCAKLLSGNMHIFKKMFYIQKYFNRDIILCSRAFHSFSKLSRAQQDITTTLPSPQEVTTILSKNEFNKEFILGSVKSFDSNQLASNDPIEDTRCEAVCKLTPGILMGVFDGHGGSACAQVVCQRLLNYVAACLLPQKLLETHSQEPHEPLLEKINDKTEIVEDLKKMYESSYKTLLSDLLINHKGSIDITKSIEQAILRLDSDISEEVLGPYNQNRYVNSKTLEVALSGAVVCLTYIEGPNMYIANVGDCNAVLGIMTQDDDWIAKKITKEHNSENYKEVNRILSEHPESESKTAIRRNRLLGELAPLRSLGDYRYKWSQDILNTVAVPLVGPNAIPANYYTPPYLSAKPDIYYHRLRPMDKFMIIASDGLWDMLTPLQTVRLVGEHMKGKVFFNPLKLPTKDIQLSAINELLEHRQESFSRKPIDRNAATHLIRHAIGGTEYGVNHSRLARLLSLAPDVRRMFRDDITVTVIYFDTEFLRQCPA